MRCTVLSLALCCAALFGCESLKTRSGIVFIDDNNNGVRDPGEEVLAGAIVFYEDARYSTAEADGRYSIDMPEGGGMLWVRGQDGLAPGPFWIDVLREDVDELDIPVVRTSGSGEFSFVVASDTHAGNQYMTTADQILGLAQAAGVDPRPYFITVTGDLTQGNKPEHFDAVFAAIDSIDIPYVPVPGNHDWYDGGEAYRSHFGPPNYAFDAGGVHFVVLEWEASKEKRMRFFDMERKLVTDDRPVVVLMHAPPREKLRAALDARGIDVLLTGHMHTNRVLQHDTFVEYNTQPMVMGGMDLTPGGFRVFHFSDDGSMRVEHRTTVNRSVFEFVSPAVSQVFAPCKATLIIAVEPGASIDSLVAMVDGVGEVALAPVGGWNYASKTLSTLCTPGSYLATADLEAGNGESRTVSTTIRIGDAPSTPALADWPMFQGDATHSGATSQRLDYPLQVEWAATVGGHIHGGSPVVADGRVFVSVSDFGDGLLGGVVAFDAKTGATLWEHRVGFSVRNAPAVSGSTVLFVSNDGTIHGVSAASGEGLWTYELAIDKPSVQRNLYSSPTIVDGIAFVGGRYEFIAVEVLTGEIVWSVPILDNFGDLSSHASAAVHGDTVVIPFNRIDGLFAFDRETGAQLWNTEYDVVRAAHASPVIDGDTVYVINELTQLTAIGMVDAESKWGVTLEGGAFGWGFLAESTPALQGTTLVVGTQRGGLFAIDTANRENAWRFTVDSSIIRATHYHGESPAITAAPVITGDVIWLPGQDGILRALDLVTGDQLWAVNLGVPMSSSPAVAGELLIVASYDGSVRAMRTVPSDE
tara:strand:+ start:50874 stop:53309 length:2436 start_codon:yes stop_codon:yes gene_type:complete